MAADRKKSGSRDNGPSGKQSIAKPMSALRQPAAQRLRPPLAALVLLTGLLFSDRAAAGVSVFDQVTTPARPFYLKLRTHRGPLAMGGVRGALWIDAQMVGRVLTGVDGYGFLKYTAATAGAFTIAARTDAGQAEGRLLVIAPTAPAVLIEVEALGWRVLVGRHEPVMRRAMRQIDASYALIYLCGLMGKKAAGELIRVKGLPESAILTGNPRDQFAQLQSRGVNLYAVVGSAALVGTAERFCRRRFSFDARAGADHVADWEDLVNQLNRGLENR